MSSEKKALNVAVIGGGPAGMTAAYELTKAGVHVDVYEAGPSVGGMAKTIELWGRRVDLGPHRFFSFDRRVNELWLEVVGKDYEIIDRLTRILYAKKFYAYPLKPFNALFNLGFFEAARCVFSYGKEKVAPKPNDGSFESWVVSHFGRRLFEIFFKNYSEKLWGVRCTEIDADFAAQRIKKLSLVEAIKNAVFPKKPNKHKTLVDQFAYPIGGTGIVYERMSQSVTAGGGNVYCKTPVSRVVTEGSKVTGLVLPDGSVRHYDHVISSMPLTLLVSTLSDRVPAEVQKALSELKFRNSILVYLKVQLRDFFPDQWIYVHSSELKTGRITNFRNWTPSTCDKDDFSIIAMEYWCDDTDEDWKATDEFLIKRASKEIKMIGVMAAKYLKKTQNHFSLKGLTEPGTARQILKDIKDFKIQDAYVHRIHRCYPVYRSGYRKHLEVVETYLRTIENLSLIGRYGAFKYNNQDHSILMGILVAENIAKNTSHDLWSVNTDYEVYQESTTITKTGLVKN